jgi:hypothetical protein
LLFRLGDLPISAFAFNVMFTDDKNGWIAWVFVWNRWNYLVVFSGSVYRTVDTALFKSKGRK